MPPNLSSLQQRISSHYWEQLGWQHLCSMSSFQAPGLQSWLYWNHGLSSWQRETCIESHMLAQKPLPGSHMCWIHCHFIGQSKLYGQAWHEWYTEGWPFSRECCDYEHRRPPVFQVNFCSNSLSLYPMTLSLENEQFTGLWCHSCLDITHDSCRKMFFKAHSQEL